MWYSKGSHLDIAFKYYKNSGVLYLTPSIFLGSLVSCEIRLIVITILEFAIVSAPIKIIFVKVKETTSFWLNRSRIGETVATDAQKSCFDFRQELSKYSGPQS